MAIAPAGLLPPQGQQGRLAAAGGPAELRRPATASRPPARDSSFRGPPRCPASTSSKASWPSAATGSGRRRTRSFSPRCVLHPCTAVLRPDAHSARRGRDQGLYFRSFGRLTLFANTKGSRLGVAWGFHEVSRQRPPSRPRAGLDPCLLCLSLPWRPQTTKKGPNGTSTVVSFNSTAVTTLLPSWQCVRHPPPPAVAGRLLTSSPPSPGMASRGGCCGPPACPKLRAMR